MDAVNSSPKKRKYIACFLVLWVAQMAAAFYFCTQKQGFHEDELYTYYSTARTNGFYVEDGKWMERETYRNEFVVLPGERFQYGLVKQVQSWDVHPPMYYWVFHTVASLVPGVFSKWIGLSVNLFFHGINLLLLAWLTYLVSKKDGTITLLVNLVYGFSPAAMSGVVFIRMYEMLTTFVLFCAILHVRVVQTIQAGWAARQAERPEQAKRACARGDSAGLFRSKRKDAEGLSEGGRRKDAVNLPAATLFLMAAVTYVGFLTQYYYFIFLFFLAAAFCLWLLQRDRKIGNCLRYVLAQGLAFGLAYLTYPAFPGQMFRGQRGAQATKNFFDFSNTFERIRFFLDLMNGYVFGYFFFIILLVMAAMAVRVHHIKNDRKEVVSGQEEDTGQRRIESAAGRADDAAQSFYENDPRFGAAFWILLIAAAGYFIAVSKTALLLGNTSNRYQLPIYGIVVLLVLYSCKTLWRQAVSASDRRRAAAEETQGAEKKPGISYRLCPAAFKVLLTALKPIGSLWGRFVEFLIKHREIMEKAAIAFCLAIVASGYLRVDVVFLYPTAKEERALAREQAAEGIPVVYVYQPGEEWCIWAVADVLMEYERVYFISADIDGLITEPAIVNADALVVYLSREDWEKKEPGPNGWIAASCHALGAYRQYGHPYCESCYYFMTEARRP